MGDVATHVEFFHPTYFDDEPEPYLEMRARDRPGWDGFCNMLRQAGWMESLSTKMTVKARILCRAVNMECEGTNGARLRGIYWRARREDL